MPNRDKDTATVQTFSGAVAVEPAPITEKEADGRYPEAGATSRESPTTCRPNVCRLKSTRRTWGDTKLQVHECDRCGYTTLDREEAKARNPALR